MGLTRLAPALVLLLAGCAGHATLPGSMSASYQESGVRVVIGLRAAANGYVLTATYTPRPGFHLYSADMPAAGVDGLGFPTVLGPGGGLRAAGTVTADKRALTFRPEGLDVTLPVYPDGPVTLSEPVTATGSTASARIGYAACSATQCLVPVKDRTVALH